MPFDLDWLLHENILFKTAEIYSNTKMIDAGCVLSMQLHFKSISLYLTIAPRDQYQSH